MSAVEELGKVALRNYKVIMDLRDRKIGSFMGGKTDPADRLSSWREVSRRNAKLGRALSKLKGLK